MATRTIELNESTILQEVNRISSLVGKQEYSNNTPLYEAVKVTDQDEDHLKDFIKEAAYNLVSSMDDICSWTESSKTITFTLSEAYMSSLNDLVDASVVKYIVNYVAAKWFEKVIKTRSEEYASLAAKELANVRESIYKKTVPTAPTIYAD